MNIPQIPTDNLYKFKAIVGVVITLLSLGYSVTKVYDLKIEVTDLEPQMVRLRIELDRGKHETEALKKKQSRNPGEDAFLQEKLDLMEVRLAEFDAIKKKLEFQVEAIRFFFLVAIVLCVLGLFLANQGFREWHRHVQRPQDALLEAQLSALKKKQSKPGRLG